MNEHEDAFNEVSSDLEQLKTYVEEYHLKVVKRGELYAKWKDGQRGLAVDRGYNQ